MPTTTFDGVQTLLKSSNLLDCFRPSPRSHACECGDDFRTSVTTFDSVRLLAIVVDRGGQRHFEVERYCAGSVTPVWTDGRPPGGGGRSWLRFDHPDERGWEREWGLAISGGQRNTLHWPRARCCCNWLATPHLPPLPMSCLYIIVSAVRRQWQLILRQSNAAVKTDVNHP